VSLLPTRKPAKKRPRGRPRTYHRQRPATNAERCRAYRQRRKRSVHFRRGSDERETGQATFNEWNARFHFTLDVCALPENAKCDRYFTPEQDGLQQDWGREICWMNPPYGRAILQWIRKAYEASKAGATVVCLLPSKTGPRWWQDYVIPYVAPDDIHFLPGRQKFGGVTHNAPFDSAVVVFRPQASYPA
jgi:phage N-6-adenine-methyltransferase